MKKVLKLILWCVGSFFLLCLVFWLCFLYVTNYKVTTRDTVVFQWKKEVEQPQDAN